MITVINSAPLPFERIVEEELKQPLAAHGFRVEPPFHKYKNQEVLFERQYEVQKEEIVLQRAIYDDERSQEVDDKVEFQPIPYDQSYLWVSRHRLTIQFVVDGATNSLQRSGKTGTGDDDWWHFADEADLRRLLRELLPLILAAGLRRFDDRLEDNRMWASTPA